MSVAAKAGARSLPGVAEALAAATASLAGLRADIERVKAEISDVEARPLPRDEVEARVEATIAELREAATRHLHLGGIVRADSEPLVPSLLARQVPPFAMLALAAPDVLRGLFHSQAEAALAVLPAPVDAATRTKRLAKLRAELAKLERQEADVMWSTLAAGAEPAWRTDIDPAALLGLDP